MFDWRTKTDEWIVKFILKAQADMESERNIIEPVYDQVIKLFQPRRYDMDDMRRRALSSGRQRRGYKYGVSVHDASPANTLLKFSNGMVGNTVNRGDTDPWWLQFTAPNQKLMEIDEVKSALQDAQDQVRFGFNQSTFYREMPKFMRDAGSTYAVMTGQEDKKKDRVVFQVRHPGSCWFKVDSLGSVIANHFKLTMSAYDLLKDFGESPEFPQSIREEAEGTKDKDANPFRSYSVIHAVYYNHSVRSEESLDSTDKPFIQFYIVTNADKTGKGKQLINKDGVDWQPITLRLGSTIEDTYPLSLAMDALTQATYGNTLSHDQLRLSQGKSNPARLIHGNLKSQIRRNRLNAGSNTYIQDAKETVEYLMNSGDWPLSDAATDKIQKAIEEVFFIPFFEAATGSAGGPQRTAYEVGQIVSEAITMMGPTIEAVEDDVFEPATSIIWAYETRVGRMPPMPDVMFEGASKVQNKYMGRLAQLRRTLPEASSTMQQLEIAERFVQLWPNALATIKDRVFFEDTMMSHGAKQKHFRSDQEMADIDQADAAAREEEKQLAIAAEAGKLMPPGKAIEPNSPAAMAAGAA